MVKMLPKSVLLGRDIPELVRIGSPEEMVATMRTLANRKREEEETTCRSLSPVLVSNVKEMLLPGLEGPEADGLDCSDGIVKGF